MQKLHDNMLIQKANEYLERKDALLEIKTVSIIQKANIIYNEFDLPLYGLAKCSIVEKMYFNFSILEIIDASGLVIGIRLVTDDNAVYQVSSFEEIQNNGDVIRKEKYQVNKKDIELLVETWKTNDGKEDAFVISSNIESDSCTDLKEKAVTEIHQAIENTLGCDNIKIYQIHRKQKVF